MRDRHERQRALLAEQSAAAIEWLAQRARVWPDRYCRQRWAGLEASAQAVVGEPNPGYQRARMSASCPLRIATVELDFRSVAY